MYRKNEPEVVDHPPKRLTCSNRPVVSSSACAPPRRKPYRRHARSPFIRSCPMRTKSATNHVLISVSERRLKSRTAPVTLSTRRLGKSGCCKSIPTSMPTPGAEHPK